jgi:hypothetical protein
MLHKVLSWLEAVSAAASLAAAAATGIPYVLDYGHHGYGCPRGQLLPCIINTKADIPAGIPVVWVSLVLLAGFTIMAVLHVMRRRRLFLWALLAIAAGFWVVFIVVEGGFFVDAYQISAVCVLICCLAAITRQVGATRMRFAPTFVALCSLAALWFFGGIVAFSQAPGEGIFRAIPSSPPDAQDTLSYAEPKAWDAKGNFIGFDRFTTDELNRIHQGRQLRLLHFVNSRTPSTGIDVVSVNPIDRFTWGAAVLSSNGRCEAVLLFYNARLAFFRIPDEHFTVLPAGTTCVGSAATPATVTGPPIGVSVSNGP